MTNDQSPPKVLGIAPCYKSQHGSYVQLYMYTGFKSQDNVSLPLFIFFFQSHDNTHFLYTRRNNLYFVGVTKFNVAPLFALELLGRYSDVYPYFNMHIAHCSLM